MHARQAVKEEYGFTLVEVLIASVVLVVGLFGTLAMLDGANAATSSTKAREQGIALQRELVEAARSLSYDQLTPSSMVAAVKSKPNLGDSLPSSPGWTIVRRGVTYTVTLGVCSVDDAADGSGVLDAAMFCPRGTVTSGQCANWLGITGSVQGTTGALTAAAAAGVGVGECGIDVNLDGVVDQLVIADAPLAASVGLCLLGTCSSGTDTNPDDYKRVISLVRWDRGAGSRYALQSTTVPNPGVSAAPAVTGVTSSGTNPVRLTAGVSLTPEAMAWYVDGTVGSTSTNTGGSGTSWWFDWNLGTVNTTAGGRPNSGEVLDGSYVISAKAFDGYGQFGATRSRTMTLNRRKPYAPLGLAAGRNGGVVDFEWAPNGERDLQGYKVYRDPLLGSDVLVCDLTAQTSCQDTSPPALTPAYYAVAVDNDTSGSLRDGDASSSVTVGLTSSAPDAPTALTGTVDAAAHTTTLSWTAPAGGLAGVDFYRIYRDGTAFANRYDRTGDATSLSWVDSGTGDTTHTYTVVAVSSNLAESAFTAQVTK